MNSRVTVLGAGFAALSSVRELRRRDPRVDITLVAPRAELHYLPGIIWIPSGLRRREQLVVPLAPFFERMRVQFRAAEVTGLRDGGRVAETSAGDVANDALVIATGGRFIRKLPGIEHSITPCEGIAAAERIRDRLRDMQGGTIAVGFAGNPNEPSAMRGGLVQADAQCRVPGRERVYVVGDSGSFPGPDWMPKQAHMADLQAAAAAANLLADLRGAVSNQTFKVELVCIVDALDRGTLIFRDLRRNVLLPPARIFHRAKRAFEWYYLRRYR